MKRLREECDQLRMERDQLLKFKGKNDQGSDDTGYLKSQVEKLKGQLEEAEKRSSLEKEKIINIESKYREKEREVDSLARELDKIGRKEIDY